MEIGVTKQYHKLAMTNEVAISLTGKEWRSGILHWANIDFHHSTQSMKTESVCM